jgi:hypothetical protein
MSMAFIPINGMIKPPTPYIIMFKPKSLETEEVARNLTPLRERGIKKGITIALKITAERTALAGLLSCIIFKTPI